MGLLAATLSPPRKEKKKLIRRFALDNSQRVRHVVQLAFVLLNAWLGIQFYLWARFFERGCVGLQVPRPAGAEGWLPIAGLMNFKVFVTHWPRPRQFIPAAMFLFMAFVAMSLLAKKSFCSWLCPVGTFSEALARIGKKIFRHNLRLPRWLDIPLRGLKYLLLAFLRLHHRRHVRCRHQRLHAHALRPHRRRQNAQLLPRYESRQRPSSSLALVLLSILIENFWCRYLCPYGALMGLASLLSPLKIRRDPAACIDCARVHTCLPSVFARRQAGHNPLRRVHGLHGLHCFLPGRRLTAIFARPRPRPSRILHSNACLAKRNYAATFSSARHAPGYGCHHRFYFSRNRTRRPRHQSLANPHSQLCLSRIGPQRRSSHPSRLLRVAEHMRSTGACPCGIKLTAMS